MSQIFRLFSPLKLSKFINDCIIQPHRTIEVKSFIAHYWTDQSPIFTWDILSQQKPFFLTQYSTLHYNLRSAFRCLNFKIY
uniref:Putative ovule protein n=1 Tax=Solanum chacoense TaxID=4108 RepID=A0A0V0GKF3_SOLCH